MTGKELRSAVNRLQAARARQDKAAAEAQAIQGQLCEYMASTGAESLDIAGWRVTYAQDQQQITVTALEQ